MDLKAIYSSKDDIPETVEFRDLFVEKNGKWELTGISGVKTQADIDRLNTGINKERERADGYRDKLKLWGDGSKVGVDSEIADWQDRHRTVMESLDSIPGLQAAAKDKLDEAQLEEMVNRRVEATLTTKTRPLERQIDTLTSENGQLKESNGKFVAKERTRRVHDAVRRAATEAKLLPEAVDDALVYADRIFEVTEEDTVITRDQVGVTPGMDPAGWLTEVQEKKPHWWPASVGGGARGSGHRGGAGGGKNPWTADGWNMTEQGQIVLKHGMERAEQMAKAAGTTVGGPRPKAKQTA